MLGHDRVDDPVTQQVRRPDAPSRGQFRGVVGSPGRRSRWRPPAAGAPASRAGAASTRSAGHHRAVRGGPPLLTEQHRDGRCSGDQFEKAISPGQPVLSGVGRQRPDPPCRSPVFSGSRSPAASAIPAAPPVGRRAPPRRFDDALLPGPRRRAGRRKRASASTVAAASAVRRDSSTWSVAPPAAASRPLAVRAARGHHRLPRRHLRYRLRRIGGRRFGGRVRRAPAMPGPGGPEVQWHRR